MSEGEAMQMRSRWTMRVAGFVVVVVVACVVAAQAFGATENTPDAFHYGWSLQQ
jgi:hypothetical protein